MSISPSGYFDIQNYVNAQFYQPNDLLISTSHSEAGGVPSRRNVVVDIPRLGDLKVNKKSIVVKGSADPSADNLEKATPIFDQIATNLKTNALYAYLTAQALNLLQQDMSKGIMQAVKIYKGIRSGIETGDQFTITKNVSCTITTHRNQMTVTREEMVQVETNTDNGDRKLEGFFKLKMSYEGDQEDFIGRRSSALKSTAAFTKIYPTMKEAQKGKYENKKLEPIKEQIIS